MWRLYTQSDTIAGMEGGQKKAAFTVIFLQYSSLLFSPAPLTLFRFPPVAHRRPPGKNEGISMLVESFFVINPVCHASVAACLSLCPSLYPSIFQSTPSHPSLPQVGELIVLSSWKKAASGDILYIEAPVCRAFCFNEKLKPQQSHLHTQSPPIYCHACKLTHIYLHTLQLARGSRPIITYAVWSPAGI